MALKMGVKVGNVDVDVGSMVKLGNELVTKARQGGCLGLYIEENFIKYAKILKERDNIKVETFGTKFYDNLDQAISQIINETGSQKTPIAVNLPGGYFDYLELFALLNNSAMKKSVDIEFEMLCQEKGINKKGRQNRFIFRVSRICLLLPLIFNNRSSVFQGSCHQSRDRQKFSFQLQSELHKY